MDVVFSIPGMNKGWHRNAFCYKKAARIPYKFSAEKQKHFIEYYEELKETVGGEPIFFIDAVHPTRATRLCYGWIGKGHKKAVETMDRTIRTAHPQSDRLFGTAIGVQTCKNPKRRQ